VKRSRAIAQTQPDRRFLFWILTGLVAATMSSAVIALATAMTMAGIS
jgi:hypothetical protein